jgi:hypothetical protein
MSYDFDSDDHSPPVMTNYVPQPHDLETIVTLIHLSAIFLTNAPGDQFTYQQLLDQFKELAGDDFIYNDIDVQIVFNNMGKSFKRQPDQHFSMR